MPGPADTAGPGGAAHGGGGNCVQLIVDGLEVMEEVVVDIIHAQPLQLAGKTGYVFLLWFPGILRAFVSILFEDISA